MTPEERRKALGGTAVPKDAAGRRTLPVMAPKMDDRPDDAGLGLKPSPYVAPYQPPPARSHCRDHPTRGHRRRLIAAKASDPAIRHRAE